MRWNCVYGRCQWARSLNIEFPTDLKLLRSTRVCGNLFKLDDYYPPSEKEFSSGIRRTSLKHDAIPFPNWIIVPVRSNESSSLESSSVLVSIWSSVINLRYFCRQFYQIMTQLQPPRIKKNIMADRPTKSSARPASRVTSETISSLIGCSRTMGMVSERRKPN